MVEIGNERAFAEVAFDGLPMTWLSTSAGDDMVFWCRRKICVTG
jgi:ribosomal protein L3 glutamine methyltransferase